MVELRAKGFGLQYFKTETSDIEHLFSTTQEAISYARVQQVPVLLHIRTQRLNSHSKSDDNRDDAEIRRLWSQDPLELFKAEYPGYYSQFEQHADKCIAVAVEAAETSPILSEASPWSISQDTNERFSNKLSSSEMRGNELIYQALTRISSG